jgi:uncharacterized protein DUF5906
MSHDSASEHVFADSRDVEQASEGTHPHQQDEGADRDGGIILDDFRAYMPAHKYIFVPNRELWPAASVDARLGPVPDADGHCSAVINAAKLKTIKASTWLDRYRPVEQMTWIPGRPMLIPDHLVSDGGWIVRPGCTCFNTYRPPQITGGDPDQAKPWLQHLRFVYPDDADHIVEFLAHRVQRPAEKINHALVLGGHQGIGKDSLLEPVKAAVGPWNFVEVSPKQLLGRFNGFLKSVILRVNEARDLGEVDRYSFYEHMKTYTAAPPDVLRVDEKNVREYVVWNVCSVIITTNHKTDGLHLPPDDRRHYVAWSPRSKEDFPRDYWANLYGWYEQHGTRHVAAFLATYDLSKFDPKAPPLQTPAFWDVVDVGRAPEDAELADALDKLRSPSATTLAQIAQCSSPGFAEWLRDRKHARLFPHRLETAGYVAARNPHARDGLWRVHERRQAIYVRHELSASDRLVAVEEFLSSSRVPR